MLYAVCIFVAARLAVRVRCPLRPASAPGMGCSKLKLLFHLCSDRPAFSLLCSKSQQVTHSLLLACGMVADGLFCVTLEYRCRGVVPLVHVSA